MSASEGQRVTATSSKNDEASRVPPRGTASPTSLHLKSLFLLILSALLIRLIYLYETSNVPFVQHLVGDAAGYDKWARQIAGGDWAGSQSFYQAPLYPYVLGTIYSIFHSDTGLIRIVQALWGALAVGLLASASTKLFNPRAGIVAGMMLAFYGPAIFFRRDRSEGFAGMLTGMRVGVVNRMVKK